MAVVVQFTVIMRRVYVVVKIVLGTIAIVQQMHVISVVVIAEVGLAVCNYRHFVRLMCSKLELVKVLLCRVQVLFDALTFVQLARYLQCDRVARILQQLNGLTKRLAFE